MTTRPPGDRPGGPRSPAADLAAATAGLGAAAQHPRPGAVLVRLEGQHKLVTMAWLIAGTHSLQVEAFFCRRPDERHAEFYRFLLQRSGQMYGVHFALDRLGDVYLTGRLPLSSITTAEIDRLLGCVLSYSDEYFDAALKIGFASSIRREWAWRVSRGQSLANLQAFASLADPALSSADAGLQPGQGQLPPAAPPDRGPGPRPAADGR